MANRVNCRKDFRPQVYVRMPGTDGQLGDPGAGIVTTLKARISATEGGAAIHAAVNDLAVGETAVQPATGKRLFYLVIDQALMETHVLPLGVGKSFWVVYSVAGDADKMSREYQVGDGEPVP